MVNCVWQWPSPTIQLLLQVGEIIMLHEFIPGHHQEAKKDKEDNIVQDKQEFVHVFPRVTFFQQNVKYTRDKVFFI